MALPAAHLWFVYNAFCFFTKRTYLHPPLKEREDRTVDDSCQVHVLA